MTSVFSRFAAVCGLGLFATAAGAAGEPKKDFLFGELNAVSHEDRSFINLVPSFGARIGYGVDSSSTSGYEIALFSTLMLPKGAPSDTAPSLGHEEGAMLDLYKFVSPHVYLMGGIGFARDSLHIVVTSPAAEIGIGIKKQLSDKWRFRWSLQAMDDFNNEIEAGKSSFIDYRLSLGFDWLGEKAAPPPPPPPPVTKPADTDNDGVTDDKDLCPTQAAATADGCPPPAPPPPPPPPADSDKDGVPDGVDACPGTLEGLKVDQRGCVLKTASQSMVLKGVSFLPNSSDLQPDAKTILDVVADSLKAEPNLKVEIDGYTDTSGKPMANLRISQARALAVRKYLIQKGIPAARLTAHGLGSANPIADNKEASGRVLNRRVELKVLQ